MNTIFKASVDSQSRDITNVNALEHRVLASVKWILDVLDNIALEVITETSAFALYGKCIYANSDL